MICCWQHIKRRIKPGNKVRGRLQCCQLWWLLTPLIEAAIDANAPALLDEDLDPALAGPVDSDEERDLIMTAISRSLSRPQPLVTRTIFPTKRKYQLVRMKEMLSNALGGNRSGGLFSVPADSARSAIPASATNETFPQSIAASPAPMGVGMAQPGLKVPLRKASIDVT